METAPTSSSPARRPRLPSRLQFQVIIVIGLAVAIVLPAGLLLERSVTRRLIASRIADVRFLIDGGAATAASRLAEAERRVASLARRLSDVPTHPTSAAEFDRLTERLPNGVVRSRRQLTDPTREAVIWLPATHPLDPATRAFLAEAKPVIEQVGDGARAPAFDDAYLTTRDGGEVTYLPGYPDYLDRPRDAASQAAWVQPTSPAENPTGSVRWAGPIKGVDPRVWYVSVMAPIHRGGTWFGAAGLDVTIEPLIRTALGGADLPGVRVLLADRSGLVLHTTGYRSLIEATGDSLHVDALPGPTGAAINELIARLPSAEGHALERTIGDTLVLATAIGPAGWRLAVLLPRPAIVAPIQAPLRVFRWGMVAVLASLLAAIVWLVAGDARRRREAQEALEQERERTFRLIQSLPMGVVVTRIADRTIVEINQLAAEAAGYTREDLIGQSTTVMGFWPDLEVRRGLIERVTAEGQVGEVPIRLKVRTGEIEVVYSARLLEVRGETLLISIFRDLSQQRNLEAQLLQTQKLEAVGRLAGGVAHDFNNLMTAVSGYAELIKGSLPADDPRRDEVEEILRASERGAEVTRQLLGFARRQIVRPRVVEINDVVTGLQRMLKPLIGEDVRLVTRLDPDAGTVRIDPGQLEQVVTNLAVNARDAMPQGGTLTIQTAGRGDRVMLEVGDTGVGITPEVRANLFEPFFTTKEPGTGSGLGLATCYGIIRQAGGSIDVESEPGQGARFRVWLPAAAEPADRVSRPVPAVPAGGHERILVVEDDASVRQIVVRVLERGGYQVVATANGAEALAWLGNGGQADLVVSDVVMPEMGGRVLAEEIRKIRPDLKVLFISGYTDDRLVREAIATSGRAFLAKPFTGMELLTKVRAVIDPAPTPPHPDGSLDSREPS